MNKEHIEKRGIDWHQVSDYIAFKGYSWTIFSIQNEYEKFKNKEYVSFTAKDVINQSILPQLK
jgi:hypothetical protein